MDDRQHDPDAAAAAERVARTVRSLDVAAPPQLRGEVAAAVARAQQREPRTRRWLRARPLALALSAGTAALVLVVVLALALSGDEAPNAAPTVPQAAQLALADPTEGAPAARPDGRLDVSMGPIVFPDWSSASWRAAGKRTDELDGHEVRTVVYENDQGERIGYAIARGELPWGGGRVVERDGIKLWVYAIDDASVVAWWHDGHTCILAGRGVERSELMRLATAYEA